MLEFYEPGAAVIGDSVAHAVSGVTKANTRALNFVVGTQKALLGKMVFAANEILDVHALKCTCWRNSVRKWPPRIPSQTSRRCTRNAASTRSTLSVVTVIGCSSMAGRNDLQPSQFPVAGLIVVRVSRPNIDHKPEVKAMDKAHAVSGLPEVRVARLPCRAHAPGFGEDRVNVPDERRPQSALVTPEGRPLEAYQFDREFHAMLARLTGGISPVALSLAFIDWASHLAAAPRQQVEIVEDALRSAERFYQAALHCLSPGQEPWSLIKPQPQDRRFAAPEWESRPFNLLAQAFLLKEQWWHEATTGVRGVAPKNEAVVEFAVRQVLDMLAPSNFAPTNPEVLQKAFRRREFRVRLAELAQRLDAPAVRR